MACNHFLSDLRNGDDFVACEPCIIATRHKRRWHTTLDSHLGTAKAFSVDVNSSHSTLVSVLFGRVCPPAICRFVVLVVINSFQRVAVRAVAHVFEKINKAIRASAPSPAYANPSLSVIAIVNCFFVVAPLLHSNPSVVGPRTVTVLLIRRQSVLEKQFCCSLGGALEASRNLAFSDTGLSTLPDDSTVALAEQLKPPRVPISGPNNSNHNHVPVPVSDMLVQYAFGNVFYSWRGHSLDCISPKIKMQI